MDRLAFQCPGGTRGRSPLRPGRSAREPTLARNVTNSVWVTCWPIPGIFPASAPTTISTSAGTAIRMLTTKASRAMPSQIAAASRIASRKGGNLLDSLAEDPPSALVFMGKHGACC